MNRRNLIIGICAVLLVVVGFSLTRTQTETVTVVDAAAPDRNDSAQQVFEQALSQSEDRELLQAKVTYQKLMGEYPDYEKIELIEGELEKLNMEIIFSNIPTSQTVVHDVVSGDTLGKLAKKYGTTIDLIKVNNHLKSDVIRIGQKLRVWTGQFNIHVDKSQNILILRSEDEVVKVYDVSTGSNNSTPIGEYTVTSRLTDPVWFNRGVVVPPESPANVLGTRWLGFDLPGYGIHGTVAPEAIGQQVTAGCVRMRNLEVEELYSIIPTGTKVSIVD